MFINNFKPRIPKTQIYGYVKKNALIEWKCKKLTFYASEKKTYCLLGVIIKL